MLDDSISSSAAKALTKLKMSFWSSCLANFLPSEYTQADRQRDITTGIHMYTYTQ